MKKALLFLLTLCSLSFFAHATLWRVNNITGVNANFADFASAATAASAGDTIYLEPSPSAYSGITISKKLTIIGNGYFVPSGFNTMSYGTQANPISSVVTGLTFTAGSEFSTIMGMYISGAIVVQASNITVKRCFVENYLYIGNYQNGSYNNLSGIDIRQNVLNFGITPYQFNTVGNTVGITNVNIQNNIIQGYVWLEMTLPAGISGYIMNNLIHMQGYAMNVYGFQINNNIMTGGTFTPNNNVYFNNIGTGTQFGTANNNQQNISTTALFSNYGTGASDSSFVLNPAGPGIGAGFSGVDVGPYGGPDPYKRSGIPPVPTIYALSAPATTTTSTLPVTISTRSND